MLKLWDKSEKDIDKKKREAFTRIGASPRGPRN